jgi:antitoxin ParD1/3/4
VAKNTNISIGEHFEDFIDAQVKSGRYSSASEMICAGLRLLEIEEDKLTLLRNALKEGELSGRAEYNLELFIQQLDIESQ